MTSLDFHDGSTAGVFSPVHTQQSAGYGDFEQSNGNDKDARPMMTGSISCGNQMKQITFIKSVLESHSASCFPLPVSSSQALSSARIRPLPLISALPPKPLISAPPPSSTSYFCPTPPSSPSSTSYFCPLPPQAFIAGTPLPPACHRWNSPLPPPSLSLLEQPPLPSLS